MATFDPEIQKTNDPNWLAYSKPIEQPNFKSTLGTDLKDAGNIFEAAVKAGDQYVQDTAKRDVQDQLQPLKDAREQQLQAASDLVRGQVAQNQPVTPGQPGDILATPAQPSALPADAQAQLKGLEVFKDARAKGSITQTDYDGRASALLSSIRSKYPPAYRDAIDSEASKIMGGDPANLHMRSLIADINSFIGGKDAEYKAAESQMAREGIKFPGGFEALQRLRATHDVEGAYKFMSGPMQREWELKQLTDELHRSDLSANQQHTTAIQLANQTADTSYQNMLHGTLSAAGLSIDQLQQASIDFRSGARPADPQQALQLQNQSMAYADAIENDIRNRLRASDKLGVLKKEEIDNAVARGRAPMELIAKSFGDKDYGSAHDIQRKTAAAAEVSKWELINDTDLGKVAQRQKTITEYFGNSVGSQLGEKYAIKKLSPVMDRFFDKASVDLATPPGGGNPNDPVQYPTMNSAIKDLTGAKSTSNPQAPYEIPKTMDALLSRIVGERGSMISRDTSDETKRTIFQNTFDQRNWGMLKTIAPDSWDKDGRLHRGQNDVFTVLTHPDIVEEAKRQGPEAVKMYQDWVKTTFEQDLHKTDLLRLRDLSGTLTTGVPGAGRTLVWDPDAHQFDIKYGNSSTMRAVGSLGIRQDPAIDTIRRLNKDLRSLVNVAEGTGQDPNRFALQSVLDLTGHGGEVDEHGNVQGLDVAKIPGIPGAMVKEIVDARNRKLEAAAKQKAFEAAIKKKYLPQEPQ